MTNDEIAAVLGNKNALIDKNALDVHIAEIVSRGGTLSEKFAYKNATQQAAEVAELLLKLPKRHFFIGAIWTDRPGPDFIEIEGKKCVLVNCGGFAYLPYEGNNGVTEEGLRLFAALDPVDGQMDSTFNVCMWAVEYGVNKIYSVPQTDNAKCSEDIWFFRYVIYNRKLTDYMKYWRVCKRVVRAYKDVGGMVPKSLAEHVYMWVSNGMEIL